MNFKTTFNGEPFNVKVGEFDNLPVVTVCKKEENKKQCIQFNKAALNLLGYRVYTDNTKVSITLGDDDEWYVVKSDLGGDVACILYKDGTVKNGNMANQMRAYMGLDESVDNSFELELQKDDTQVYAKLVKI
jgi:hypothetical protein